VTRCHFLAGLFGFGAIAKAQTPDAPIYGRILEYRNGMCPVCGTMAEPWTEVMRSAEQMPEGTYVRRGDWAYLGRRVDCAKCGNTFRQEAEAGK
jgi:ribosomal protein S27AE